MRNTLEGRVQGKDDAGRQKSRNEALETTQHRIHWNCRWFPMAEALTIGAETGRGVGGVGGRQAAWPCRLHKAIWTSAFERALSR